MGENPLPPLFYGFFGDNSSGNFAILAATLRPSFQVSTLATCAFFASSSAVDITKGAAASLSHPGRLFEHKIAAPLERNDCAGPRRAGQAGPAGLLL